MSTPPPLQPGRQPAYSDYAEVITAVSDEGLMSHFNFGNFLVDESNHDAFQVCQDIADLVPVSPLPVLIVGDEGCGKSHLLYSIVNRLRAGTAKTGLALVTANAFPAQVRGLIGDPSPVAKAKSAVLLIDQLEQFRDNLEELEGVVRIFLDHNHYVIAATSIHPGRLRELPDGLRRLFESGTVAAIKPSESTPQIERVRQQIRSEHQDELDRAEKDIAELRMLLKEATGSDPSELTPADHSGAAELKVLTDQLRNALAEAEEAREAADSALSAAVTERDALMLRETEVLAEAEAKHQAELSPLRERLSESATRLSELDVRAEVLESEANEAKAAREKSEQEQDGLDDQINALKTELEDAAKPDEALLTEMESLRTLLAAAEEARDTERDRLDAEHADTFAKTQEELTQMRTNNARLEEDIEALRSSKEDDVGRMRAEIDRLESERTQMDDEVNRRAEDHGRDTQSLHDQLAAQHVELETLRAQAAEAEAVRATEVETSKLAEERESLAQELGEVRLDHDRLLQRLTEMETGATAVIQERDAALAARDEAQAARAEALERAEHVLDQVEANRGRMAEAAEHRRTRIADLEQRLSDVNTEESGTQEAVADLEQRLMQAEHAAEGRGQALEAVTEQTRSLEQALEETRSRRDADVDSARKEASDAIEQLDRVQRQFDETQAAFDLAQNRVRSLESDLNALQVEAAAQVARANTQAGETEHRLARILNAFETAAAENRALRDELGEPNGSAENSVSRLMLLAQRLAISDPGQVARAINPDSYDSDPSI